MNFPSDHDDCAADLRQQMAGLGCDATVSTLPPIVPSPYGVASFHCPHGVEFFTEPTGEQIAAWARDGVR